MAGWDAFRQDWVFGWRSLRRSPGFALTALLMLALGIAAATGMFSVIESVWLRPLPYRDPGRLVAIWSELPHGGVAQSASAYGNIEDWRRTTRTLDGLIAYDGQSFTVADENGGSERISATLVSAGFLSVLGVRPELGREFTTAELDGRAPVVVIAHEFWQRRYGGDPAVLGRRLVIDGRPMEIIGVTPSGFFFPDGGSELWLPASAKHDWDRARALRGLDSWRVIARLAPGATVGRVRAEFATIAAALEHRFPENQGLGIQIVPLSQQVTGHSLRLALVLLAGAVLCVLLIACTNIGNLLLVRGVARQREFAVREALGASRRRVVRQLMVESTILAGGATLLGAALVEFELKAVRAFGPARISRLEDVRLDSGALGFAIAVAVSSAAAFTLIPALASTRRDPMAMLRGASRGASSTPAARRLRGALVVAEIAVAGVLLVANLTFVRSFVRLTAVDPGFHVRHAVVVSAHLPPDRSADETLQYVNAVLARVSALPGIKAAGFTEDVLLGFVRPHDVAGDLAGPNGEPYTRIPLSLDAVTPDYFRAAGVTLLVGRYFSDHDVPGAPPVVIINEALARRLWGAGNPIGHRLRLADPESPAAWAEVVGVVTDLRRQQPETTAIAQTFWPLAQHPSRSLQLVVQTSGDGLAMAPTIRAAVVGVDRTIPVGAISTLQQELDARLADRRFNLALLTAFAVVALALAEVGIFGLMSYTIAQRSRELGIRLALGATPRDLVKFVMREGLQLSLIGIAAGAVVAAMVLRAFSGLLYHVAAVDVASFVAAAVLLFCASAVACYVAARRVPRLDPIRVLQLE